MIAGFLAGFVSALVWVLGTDVFQGLRLWLEATFFGTFVRESTSAFGYPTFIVLHTVGLAVVVGTSTLVALRVLGFASTIPIAPLGRLFPLIWGGFAINLFSGSGLAAATADGQFTNPVFTAKIVFVVLAVTAMRLLQKSLFLDAPEGEPTVTSLDRQLAGSMVGLWLLAMVAGRLIAYAGVIVGR